MTIWVIQQMCRGKWITLPGEYDLRSEVAAMLRDLESQPINQGGSVLPATDFRVRRLPA